MHSARIVSLWVLLSSAGACISTSPKASLGEASQLVRSRSGEELRWFGEGGQEAAIEESRKLLSKPLTLASAIQVSLLSNAELQAKYEELGISQADLAQAGRLKNPSLGSGYFFSLSGPGVDGFNVGLATELLQFLTLGARKDIARFGLEGTKYRVAAEVLRHFYGVKLAYFSVQAAQQTTTMREIVSGAAHAAVELSRRQNAAGTNSDLDLANEESLYAQTTMDLARSRAELAAARERLNRTMGVWGANAGWTLQDKLPDVPEREPPRDHLESRAVAARYDLLALHKDVELISYSLSLAKNTRWLGGIDAGVRYEKSAEGVRLLGPTVSVELPIFDQRQGTIARIEAQLRQAQNRERLLAVNIRSEVRELCARLEVARRVVDTYRTTLVPMRERIVALSQQQYDAMLLGVFQLLISKQNEISTYREMIDATRDYWTLRAELEWAVGGNLGPETVGASTTSDAANPRPAPGTQERTQEGAHEHHQTP